MSDKSVKVEVDWNNLFHRGIIYFVLITSGVSCMGAFNEEEDPSGRVTCYNGGEVIYTSVAQYEGGGTYIETESRDRVIVSGDCVFRANRNE